MNIHRPGKPYHDVLTSFLEGCGVTGPVALTIASDAVLNLNMQPSKTEITDLLLSLIGQGMDQIHPVTYVSAPITSGRAYLEWATHNAAGRQDSTGEAWAIRHEVISANTDRAHIVIRRIRERLHGMVIDPTRLINIDGWRQVDYHNLWTRVIARYADNLIFIDGWQYSVGCTIEFAEGIKLRLPTMTEHCDRLDVDSGLRLVRAALREYAEAHVDLEPLRSALEVVEKAASLSQTLNAMYGTGCERIVDVLKQTLTCNFRRLFLPGCEQQVVRRQMVRQVFGISMI